MSFQIMQLSPFVFLPLYFVSIRKYQVDLSNLWWGSQSFGERRLACRFRFEEWQGPPYGLAVMWMLSKQPMELRSVLLGWNLPNTLDLLQYISAKMEIHCHGPLWRSTRAGPWDSAGQSIGLFGFVIGGWWNNRTFCSLDLLTHRIFSLEGYRG